MELFKPILEASLVKHSLRQIYLPFKLVEGLALKQRQLTLFLTNNQLANQFLLKVLGI
jgi:hypothetical protein